MKIKYVCPKCEGEVFVRKSETTYFEKYHYVVSTQTELTMVHTETMESTCTSRIYCNSCGYEFKNFDTWADFYKSLGEVQEEETNKEGEEK